MMNSQPDHDAHDWATDPLTAPLAYTMSDLFEPTRVIQFIQCPHCDDSGVFVDHDDCPDCKGTGCAPRGLLDEAPDCPRCTGTGWVSRDITPCPFCGAEADDDDEGDPS
jgi:DnaJ-class molecular chaperone